MLARYPLAPSVFELELERDSLDYRPGDCTLLIRDGVDSRPYSLSSHPDEPVLRFLIRTMTGLSPQDSFSQWLADRNPGDWVGVGTPFGWFHPGSSENEVWFATGTGISPFLSVLRARTPIRPLGLYAGFRSPEDRILGTWIEENAPVQWAFSRPKEGETPPRRVTDFLDQVSVAPEIQYFLCGNPRMIQAVSEALGALGVEPSRIHEELYFR